MKIGWVYKRYDGDDVDFTFSEEEPEWKYEIRQIVYAEITK